MCIVQHGIPIVNCQSKKIHEAQKMLLAITCRQDNASSALKQSTTEWFTTFVLGVMSPR